TKRLKRCRHQQARLHFTHRENQIRGPCRELPNRSDTAQQCVQRRKVFVEFCQQLFPRLDFHQLFCRLQVPCSHLCKFRNSDIQFTVSGRTSHSHQSIGHSRHSTDDDYRPSFQSALDDLSHSLNGLRVLHRRSPKLHYDHAAPC